MSDTEAFQDVCIHTQSLAARIPAASTNVSQHHWAGATSRGSPQYFKPAPEYLPPRCVHLHHTLNSKTISRNPQRGGVPPPTPAPMREGEDPPTCGGRI